MSFILYYDIDSICKDGESDLNTQVHDICVMIAATGQEIDVDWLDFYFETADIDKDWLINGLAFFAGASFIRIIGVSDLAKQIVSSPMWDEGLRVLEEGGKTYYDISFEIYYWQDIMANLDVTTEELYDL